MKKLTGVIVVVFVLMLHLKADATVAFEHQDTMVVTQEILDQALVLNPGDAEVLK